MRFRITQEEWPDGRVRYSVEELTSSGGWYEVESTFSLPAASQAYHNLVSPPLPKEPRHASIEGI